MTAAYKIKTITSTAFLLLILWFPLHLLPKTNTPDLYQHTDKIIHFSLFFLWTFINSKILKNKKNVFLFASLLAIISETGQIFIPFRSFDIFDIIFDLLGVIPTLCLLKLKKLPNEN
tara:strand:+ start:336 stop:686 length:351 start_codon:yes stop_codon:yes gene_type:complete